MNFKRSLFSLCIGLAALISPVAHGQGTDPEYWAFAERPVMGWNSWDFYGTTVTEAQTKAQADYMAANLLAHGWELITVDIQWYAPDPATAAGGNFFVYFTPNSQLAMDGYGRLQPASTRFPSAAGGNGFTDLAAYVHNKGLKFGIHIMRGIPKQAYNDDLPILGTAYSARDIADTNSECYWQWEIHDNWGVDSTKPGAQEYYDSIISMYAGWGVDFIKVDDISRYEDATREGELGLIRNAIDKVYTDTGHKIILSTSPGETPLEKGDDIMVHANQWRISDDFWDNWGALYPQFQRLHDWTPFRGPGHFPDADMLPLGKIGAGSNDLQGRESGFTDDEQYTLMTLWSIARSPLIHGGDMTQMDAFTLSLMTNDEVIAVNQYSENNRQFYREGDFIAWVADDENTNDKYLALFNAGAASAEVPADLSALGFTGSVAIRSLWDHADLGSFNGSFAAMVNSHGAGLFRLSGDWVPTPWITGAAVDFGNNQINLSWETTAPLETTYSVKRATSPYGPFVTIAQGLATPSYADPDFRVGVTYFYAVSATISGQETPDSLAVSVNTLPGMVGWNYDRYGTVSGDRVAGVEPQANWNNSWPDNPTVNLIDENGEPTTLDITYSSYNDWSVNGQWGPNPGQDADGTYNRELLNGYLNAGPAGWNPPTTRSEVVLSEIPYPEYDIIVYFSSDVAGREGILSNKKTAIRFSAIGPTSVTGSNAILTEAVAGVTTYEPANYGIFKNLTGSTQTIFVQMRDNDEWGGIAAFQVVPHAAPPLEEGVWQETAIGWVFGFAGNWGYSSIMGFVYVELPYVYQLNFGWSYLGDLGSFLTVSNEGAFLYNYAEGWIQTQPSYGTRFWVVGSEEPFVFKDFLQP